MLLQGLLLFQLIVNSCVSEATLWGLTSTSDRCCLLLIQVINWHVLRGWLECILLLKRIQISHSIIYALCITLILIKETILNRLWLLLILRLHGIGVFGL